MMTLPYESLRAVPGAALVAIGLAGGCVAGPEHSDDIDDASTSSSEDLWAPMLAVHEPPREHWDEPSELAAPRSTAAPEDLCGGLTPVIHVPAGGTLYTATGPAKCIIGTEGLDRIRGTKFDDIIVGLGGNDELDGGDGNDVIWAGDGNDILTGGDGADQLYGEGGGDQIDAGKGNDAVQGGAGNDSINGGKNDDTIDGGDGNDVISGGGGTDTINGGAGNDVIFSDKKDEQKGTVEGGPGIDSCTSSCLGCEPCELAEPATGIACATSLQCADGNACSTDTCDPLFGCVITALVCDDGAFCNGTESCNPVSGCIAGVPPSIDDEVVCTHDVCDESTDAIDHTVDDESCGPGTACASFACDAVLDCVPSYAPSGTPCDDDDACTAGDECNGAGLCVGGPTSCWDTSDVIPPEDSDFGSGDTGFFDPTAVSGPGVPDAACSDAGAPVDPPHLVLWTRTCGGEGMQTAPRVAVHADGDITVAGPSGGMRRYEADGDLSWANDFGRAVMTVAADGAESYAAGSLDSNNWTAFWISRVSEHGSIVWEGAQAIDPYAYAVGMDRVASSDDALIVTLFGGGVLTRRYTASGQLAWQRIDRGWLPGDIASSAAGELAYVVGQHWPTQSLVLAAFDADDGAGFGLRLLGSTEIGAPLAPDRGGRIAVAPNGDLWVAATIEGVGDPDPNAHRGWLGHFSSSGILQSSTSYEGGEAGPDRFMDLAIDDDGYVYVVGMHGAAVDDTDILVRAYTPQGVPVWTDVVTSGVTSTEEFGTGVAIASDGVVVSGQIMAAADDVDWWLRAYAP
ncbi:MAG TPA: hypothetical protein VG755_38275 [Nannocystaceae bacterium]|nr:hypothetical protein [Nannocystaceae bacterium]